MRQGHGAAWPARLALGALALSLAGLSMQAVAARATVTLCYERQDVLPWRSQDGKGLNFELLERVAARLDLKFDYQSMPWKRCLEQVKANEVGGAFAVSFNASRAEMGAFPGGLAPDASKRMHVDRYYLVRRKGSRVGWDGKRFTQVDGAIGVQLGYSVADFLRANHQQVDEGSQRVGELAQKLVAGRIAAAAVGGSDTDKLKQGPLAPQLEVLPVPLIEKPYFLMLSHALVKSQPRLAERLWDSVEAVRNSSAYRKLARDAEGRPVEARVDGGRH
jgi:polar amino acid transport system substrate-binding protein